MERERQNKIDAELEELWQDGLDKDMAEKLICEVQSFGEVEPPAFLKTRLKAIDAERSQRWRRAAPVLVPVLLSLFIIAVLPAKNDRTIAVSPDSLLGDGWQEVFAEEDQEQYAFLPELFDEELLILEEL